MGQCWNKRNLLNSDQGTSFAQDVSFKRNVSLGKKKKKQPLLQFLKSMQLVDRDSDVLPTRCFF